MPFSLPVTLWQSRPAKKECLCFLAGTAAVVVVGYAGLYALSLLPQEKLRNNVLRADARGFFSDNYPHYEWLRPVSNRLDMYTECLGLGIALNMRPDAKTLLEMPTFGECSGLRAAGAENFAAVPHAYMRYIHGYQLVLKSLYTFFPIEAVRAVVAGTSLFLLLALFLALSRKTDVRHAALVAASFFFTASPNMFFTATHAVQFWVVLAAAVAAVLRHTQLSPLCFFGTVGALDAFFSFLSMGSLSLALPLLCYTLVMWTQGASPERVTAAAFWGCIGWSLGFLIPWPVKWLVLRHELAPTWAALFGTALEQYPAHDPMMILTALINNFFSANWPWIVCIFVALVLRKRRLALRTPPGLWAACLPGLIPLLWICILPGQSGVKHSSYMNLILWPFFAACLLLLLPAQAVPPGAETGPSAGRQAQTRGSSQDDQA